MQAHNQHSDVADRSPPAADHVQVNAHAALAGEAQRSAHELQSMSPDQRRQFYTQLAPSTAHAESVLPHLDITTPGSDQPAKLPTHLTQTDNGVGTRQNPINNNCQTTTLKNLFNFYGMDGQASKVNDWQTQLLHEVHDNHGKNIDFSAIDGSFGPDPRSQKGVKDAIRHGQLDNVFQSDVTMNRGHEHGAAATPEEANLFLSQMGCKPHQVPLGTRDAAREVQAALDSGKPVMIGDSNTHTLLQRALAKPGEAERPPVQGHTYMAYKKDGHYYVADPGYPHPVEVSAQILQAKLMDRNSQATVINRPPDPSRFLHH